MRRPVAEREVEPADPGDDGRHRDDGVLAEVGAGAVGRAAGRLRLEPDEAAVRDADREIRGLGDDGPVGRDRRRDRLAPERGQLLVDDRGDDDVARGPHPGRMGPGEHDRGEPRLHVAGPAPVQPPALDPRHERLAHPGVADGVDVAVEEQRPPAAPSRRPRDDVRAARSDLLDPHLEPGALEPPGDESRDRAFSGAALAISGIHGVDRDQLA